MVNSTSQYLMLINGELIGCEESIDVINPATEEVVAMAPKASQEALENAILAANFAFNGWSALDMSERQEYLRTIGNCIIDNKEELSKIFVSEMGRPLAGAYWEMETAAQWCMGVAKYDLPVEIVDETEERRIEMRHTPIGVVGAIAPWNAPLLIAIWKIAPALLAGNTVVLKPSPYTPLTTLKLGMLLADVLPPGVLNIVSGDDDLGKWLSEHPKVGKVSFTGSTATGRKVMESASKTLKRITLELGGNDAAIVLPDVDPKVVAPALFWGAFFNSAQVCVATKRLYVHEDIYDEVAEEIVKYSQTINVGNGAEENSHLGPVQNKMQFEKVQSIINDSKSNGYKFLTGGGEVRNKGYFIPVTIVDNPPEDSRVVQEEAFGPILPMLKYSDINDAIRRANSSDTGLGGSVWSNNVDEAVKVAARLETGTVWINEMFAFSPNATFSGHKQSGVGVEHGIEGLLEFTNTQTITVKKLVPMT